MRPSRNHLFRSLYRDPADVRTILSMAWTGTLLVLLLLASVALNIWQYWRRPDRIVVDRSSGRVLMINDREYGETEAVKLGPDKLTNADKQYLAGEFVKAIYQVDPATRPRDIERALRMMAPASALLFARYLKQTGILDKQRAESWQAVWTPQDISVDGVDPYTVRVIGKQEITKVIAGATQQETRQLTPDAQARGRSAKAGGSQPALGISRRLVRLQGTRDTGAHRRRRRLNKLRAKEKTMFNHKRYVITLVALTVVLSAHSAQGQVKAKRDKAPETTKKESGQPQQRESGARASVPGHARRAAQGRLPFR